MSLTPEEKSRIYEEEKARKQAQDSLKAAEAAKGLKGCLVLFAALAVVLFLLFMLVVIYLANQRSGCKLLRYGPSNQEC